MGHKKYKIMRIIFILTLISVQGFGQCVIDGTTLVGPGTKTTHAKACSLTVTGITGIPKFNGTSAATLALAGSDYSTPSSLSDSLNSYMPLAGTVLSNNFNLLTDGNSFNVYGDASPLSEPYSRMSVGGSFATLGWSLTAFSAYNFTSTSSGLSMGYTDSDPSESTIRISNSAMTVTDNQSSKGLYYAADYSSGATDRWLIDKGYINSSINGTSGQVSYFNGTNTVTSESDLTYNSTTNALGVTGPLTVGSSSTTGASITNSKNITGATTSYGIRNNGSVQSDATTAVINYSSEINTQATSFTLTDYRHFFASQGTIGAGSSVTNQYGFQVSSGLTGATTNYGFYSNLASSTTARWNMFMAGTAPNYLAGKLGIMTTMLTVPTSDLTVNGSLGLAYVAKTGAYGIGASDYTIDCTSGTFTVTLPTAASITGRIYVIKNSGAGVITVATTSSQTIDGSTTYTLNTQYQSITVQSNGSNWIIL